MNSWEVYRLDVMELWWEIKEDMEKKGNKKREEILEVVDKIRFSVKKEELLVQVLYQMVQFLLDRKIDRSYFYSIIKDEFETYKDEEGNLWMKARKD